MNANRILTNAVAWIVLWAVWIATIVLIFAVLAMMIRFLVGAP